MISVSSKITFFSLSYNFQVQISISTIVFHPLLSTLFVSLSIIFLNFFFSFSCFPKYYFVRFQFSLCYLLYFLHSKLLLSTYKAFLSFSFFCLCLVLYILKLSLPSVCTCLCGSFSILVSYYCFSLFVLYFLSFSFVVAFLLLNGSILAFHIFFFLSSLHFFFALLSLNLHLQKFLSFFLLTLHLFAFNIFLFSF